MRLLQHADVETIIQRETIVLREDLGITLDIQSVHADFDGETEAELPSPMPPRLGVEKDGKGHVLLDDNQRPIVRYGYDDPDYREKKRIVGKLQAVKTIVDGLAPDQVEWEADKEALGPRQFYIAVLGEMKAFGLGMGDMLTLITAIGKLSGLTEKDIKAAELGFSTEEEEEVSDSDT